MMNFGKHWLSPLSHTPTSLFETNGQNQKKQNHHWGKSFPFYLISIFSGDERWEGGNMILRSCNVSVYWVSRQYPSTMNIIYFSMLWKEIFQTDCLPPKAFLWETKDKEIFIVWNIILILMSSLDFIQDIFTDIQYNVFLCCTNIKASGK